MTENKGCVYKSPYPASYVPTELSISQFLSQTNPDDVPLERIVFCDFDNPTEVVTYGGLRNLAAQYAAGLQEVMDLQVGDFVSIHANNSISWVLLAHAILWAGASFSATNPAATSFELVHYLRVVQPKVVAVEEALLQTMQDALNELGDLHVKVLVIGTPVSSTQDGFARFPHDFSKPRRAPLPPFNLAGHDNRQVPAVVVFSSGTSGKPKGVVMSHHNLIAQLLGLRATNPFTHNGTMREVFYPSFGHIYGIVSGLMIPAWVGSYLVTMRKFDFIPYLKRCSDINATILRLVPATAIRLTKDPAVKPLELSFVKWVMCSGAALASETVTELQRILHPDAAVLNGWGMSEATITLQRETRTDKAGSVGRLQSGVSVRIVDDDGKDVELGKDGECLVQGPTVFMRYMNNPDETRAAFVGPWLRTGDVVHIDEDGFFWFTGRKKELIKYKGNQVAPAELEAVLLSHPLVSEAGVCGLTGADSDSELVAGCVVLVSHVDRNSRETALVEIQHYFEARVSPYKKLRGGLHELSSLPKGSTGKVLRRELPNEIKVLRKVKSRL